MYSLRAVQPMNSEPDSIKSVIAGYLNKYLVNFSKNLDKAMHEYDPEAIHEYRVSVKRIRAVVRALNQVYQTPLFPPRMIFPLREMFKAGGSIRDDQVQINLVENVESKSNLAFPLIKLYYFQKIEDQRNSFFLKSVDFDYDSLGIIMSQVENALAPLDENDLETNLYSNLQGSMDKLKRKRYDLERPESLHRFRTQFKENGYVAEMLYQSQHIHKITRSAYSRMKKFGLALGNWHDHYQLWTKTVMIFQESRNNELLRESFELRKLITPVHDKLFQEMLHLIKRDDSIFIV